MMNFKFAAIAAFAAIVTTTSASALSLAQGATPAETPPASYKGDVYVDSRGCAYVRAGVGGGTNWVPRVTRERKVVCGLAPTFARSTAAEAPAPAPAPAPATKPVVRAPSPAPAPTVASAPRRVTAAPMPIHPMLGQPGPAPAPRVAPRVASVPRETRATATPQATPQTTEAAGQMQTIHVACVNPGDQVIASAGGLKLRYTCTAREQAVRTVRLSNGTSLRIIATRSPHAYVRNTHRAAQTAPASGRAAPGTRVATRTTRMAEGYRSAWDDDRLNRQRGPRTAAGDAQMARVWDNRVPMRPTATAVSARAGISERSPAQVGNAGSYIQAASFANPANAQRTARRIANLGLPVRTLKVTRRGKVLRLVQAGPFADSSALHRALGQVRGLGFADAYATR